MAESVFGVSQGKVRLPSKQQMASEVETGRNWRLGFMPVNEIFAGRLQNLCQGYFDELVGDMGERIYRKVLTPGFVLLHSLDPDYGMSLSSGF